MIPLRGAPGDHNTPPPNTAGLWVRPIATARPMSPIKPELMPQAAVDLVWRDVNVIAALTPGGVDAARNATTSIPIVALDLENDPVADSSRVLLARAAI